MDKVLIRDLHVRGIIGAHDWERTKPQQMMINLTVYTDIADAAASDDVADCVDYATLADRVQAHAETAERFTVEALAEDIAGLVLEHPRVARVKVQVEKPGAVRFAAAVGVRITRSRTAG
jgi:FolB domain-containing protein